MNQTLLTVLLSVPLKKLPCPRGGPEAVSEPVTGWNFGPVSGPFVGPITETNRGPISRPLHGPLATGPLSATLSLPLHLPITRPLSRPTSLNAPISLAKKLPGINRVQSETQGIPVKKLPAIHRVQSETQGIPVILVGTKKVQPRRRRKLRRKKNLYNYRFY